MKKFNLLLALWCFTLYGVGQTNSPITSIPTVDLNHRNDLQVVIDKEKGQYLGHPTTYLCNDQKTIYCVYPKGHGSGTIVLKRSDNGGKTWSDRLPTPPSWATSKEVPTLYKTVDEKGKERILLVTGAQTSFNVGNRIAYSEDDAKSWTELFPIKNQEKGGVVAYSDMIALHTGKGHYMATYHFEETKVDEQGKYRTCDLYVTFTQDGGVTWSAPKLIHYGIRGYFLCEGGFVRSPDGKTIAVLLRENSKNNLSQVMFSYDEGYSWTKPKDLPPTLCGDRHQAIALPDGRLLIQFRDISPWNKVGKKNSPTEGDWVGWMGKWEDIVNSSLGEYRIRFKDNLNGGDTAYPAVELLPDGTLVCTTYGHFDKNEMPYIVCVRFKISETDALAAAIRKNGQPKIINDYGDDDVRIFDPMNPDAINKAISK